MEKLLKRVVSVIVALAMVVAGLTFVPSQVNASTEIPSGVDTATGAWHLKATNERWAGWARMSYDQAAGNALGATTMHLINSAGGEWDDVEYGSYARLKHYSKNKMAADMPYRLAVTINANNPGTLKAMVEGKVYDVPVTENGGTFYSEYFDHDEFAALTEEQKKNDPLQEIDDVTFFLGTFPKNTDITISEVTFEAQPNPEWTPVPNWNPDEHSSTDVATYTTAGQLDLLAMYGIQSKMYGKMKYKLTGDGSELDDTTVLVTKSSGWDNFSTGIRLTNYLQKKGLAEGDIYNGTITIGSNKDTGTDKFGDRKKIKCTICGNAFYTELNAGEDNVIQIDDFKYVTGKHDISFDVDQVEPGTELVIKDVNLKNADGDEWTTVKNETETQAGIWELFARTGETIEEGQWAALSYKFNNNPATEIGDTTIKVRSSSGWLDAWACMGTLADYANGMVQVGHTYKPVIHYKSTKATGTDDAGDPKTVLFSFDKQNRTFPLEATDNGEATLEPITFEANNDQKTYDIIFNFDQVEPRTELTITGIEFVEYNPQNWQVLPNGVYTQIGSSKMKLFADFNAEHLYWSKTSYKFDNPSVQDDYSKVTIKTRTTTGWWIPYEPTSAAIFDNLGMTEANRYKFKVTLTSNRADDIKAKDGSAEEEQNYLKIISGDDELQQEFDKTPLKDNEETTFETDFFTYKGTKANQDSCIVCFDSFTKNSEIQIKNVELIRDESQPEWMKVPDSTAKKVGKWNLYAKFSAPDELWGQMFYNKTTKPDEEMEMGDTTMYCYTTSGWFASPTTIKATLNNYTKNDRPLQAGQNYATYIKLKSTKACKGKDKEGNDNGIKVTIDNTDYLIPIYQGEYTYVIPKLNQVYQNQGKDNVVFNFDKLDAETQITISSVEFGPAINSPVDISAFATEVQSNGSVKVTWEQTKDTIYGTVGNEGKFKVYVDGIPYVVDGNVRTYTTAPLSDGEHTIKVVATLGGRESTGKSETVDVKKQDPTQAPTQKPTAKPTVKPTQGPSVKVPGKAKVKKAVKKKKSAKKIKVTLKKIAGATKYQVAVYKTKKNAKKNKKALVKKIVTKLKATIKSKKLKGKKTVYVRVRAWNTAGYGKWSGVKKSKKK